MINLILKWVSGCFGELGEWNPCCCSKKMLENKKIFKDIDPGSSDWTGGQGKQAAR